MILVYQMGKVASHSWYEAIRAAAPAAGEPVHIHLLSATGRRRLAGALQLPAPRQTIANRILPREQLRKGAAALARIDACRRAGQPIRIIAGVRDPIARSVSSLIFLTDFYGHTERKISHRQGATAEDLSNLLVELWLSVFDEREPSGSFEWVARNAIGLFRRWFADELEAVFGVDILSSPFPAAGGQRLSGAGVEVLVYRVEDMLPTSAARAPLLAAGSDFLGLPLSTFPEANTAVTRRSYPLYAAVRERFRLPSTLIDAIYDDKVIRHFYTQPEIAAFKQRWCEAHATA